ncbi:MAG: hypothetical protein WBQ73_02140 [Candidatus Babeliales bacterium]
MKPTSDNILVCETVKFYCYKDEEAFFDWIKKIECISQFSGKGKTLYLHITTNPITDQDLDDLIGLFCRYNIDMKQLARFLTNKNKTWFYDNKKAFWYQKVF